MKYITKITDSSGEETVLDAMDGFALRIHKRDSDLLAIVCDTDSGLEERVRLFDILESEDILGIIDAFDFRLVHCVLREEALLYECFEDYYIDTEIDGKLSVGRDLLRTTTGNLFYPYIIVADGYTRLGVSSFYDCESLMYTAYMHSDVLENCILNGHLLYSYSGNECICVKIKDVNRFYTLMAKLSIGGN